MAVYPVKWFASDMQGAPSLGDTADGAMAALLKAVLVTGFGTMTINALSFDAAKGWAVATFNGGHKYLKDSVVLVEGVSPAAYNGEHRVMQVSSNQVWFELDGGNPGSMGSGAAMTMKVAALGWTITHESPDGKVFILRPTNVSESGNISLRVDNSAWSGWAANNQYLAKVQMVEDVVDLNTFTLVFEHRWPCTGRFGNKTWTLIGDSQLFYFLPAFGFFTKKTVLAFGYIRSVRPGDRYHAILTHHNRGDTTGSSGQFGWDGTSNHQYYSTFALLDSANYRAIARPFSQLFGSTSFWFKGLFGRFGAGLSVPNGPDNAFYMSADPVMVIENGNHLRGYQPGIICPYGSISAWGAKNFADLPATAGKIVRFEMVTYSEFANTADTMIGFDITGPWR